MPSWLGWGATAGQALLVFFLCFAHFECLSQSELALVMASEVAISVAAAIACRALAAHERSAVQTRERAARGERLTAIAALSASAAHELGTPLSTIAVAAAELCRSTDPDVADDARLIREQIARCRALLSDMAEDARGPATDAPACVTLEQLVTGAVERLSARDRVRVEWARDVDPRADLLVPRRATVRALRNVLKNGLDASRTDRDVVLRLVRSPQGDVTFEVRDEGTGMAPDVVARVTDPFFTTKPRGAGMGLGLYLTRAVMDLLGGQLTIESELGRGTRVSCTLPGALTRAT